MDADLNTYKTPGTYYFSGIPGNYNGANFPVNDSGKLQVMSQVGIGGYIEQIYHSANSINNIYSYSRRYDDVNKVWGNWVYHIDNRYSNDENPLKNLILMDSGSIAANTTISISNANAHLIFIIAYGTWNYSVLLAVFPNNSSAPIVKVICGYSSSSAYQITANGSWGINIKNTGSSNMPCVVIGISK